MFGRLPLATEAEVASMPPTSARSQGRAVALERTRGRLRLREQGWRELRVLELAQHVLARAERVVDELLERGRRRLALPGLAGVLVEDHERLRGDRVGRRIRRVDDRQAEVRRDLHALAGRRRR